MELKTVFRAEPIQPLASILEAWAAGPSSLRVIAQDTLAPPHARTVAPPLSDEAVLLRRITGYGVGRFELSRHIAFTDLGGIDAELAARLLDGRTNLGKIFEDPRVKKSLFSSGDESSAEDEVLCSLAARGAAVSRYLWRRYGASFEGRPAFLVIELLDLSALENAVRQSGRAQDLKR